MSGHSKWSTIKNKKEKADNERAKIFTRLSREIFVAVKKFGADVESNRKLRDLIVKAKVNNLPGENIERVIKKAVGYVDKNCYEEVVYEGYGPSGVAVLIEALTDNRNRTASNIRHYFEKFGGKLSTPGSVSFMFSQKGFIVSKKANLSEDEAIDICLNLEAVDFKVDGDLLNIEVVDLELNSIVEKLKELDFEILMAESRKVSDNYISLSNSDDVDKCDKLIQILDDDCDVQRIWTNLEG